MRACVVYNRAFRESGHNHTIEDYTALLDFMDLLHIADSTSSASQHGNGGAGRDFQRALYPDLGTYNIKDSQC